MLSRFLIPPLKTTSHHLPFLTTLISSNKYLPPPPPNPIHNFHVIISQPRFFSSNTSGGKDDNPWKITAEDDIFKEEDGNFSNDIGTSRANGGKDDTTHNNPWKITDKDDIFKDFSNDIGTSRANVGNVESWDVTNESKTGGDVFGDIDKEVESRKSVVGSRRTNVGNVESWDFTSTNESKTGGDVFGDVDKEFESKEKLGGIGSRRSNVGNVESWNTNETKGDVFGDIDKESGGGGEEEWESAQEMKGWSIGDDDKVNDIFNIGGEEGGIDGIEDLSSEVEDNRNAKNEVQQELEMEKKQLLLQLKGPNRAFGDLIAAAGITDAMLDSLIALKDLEGVEGLSPLSEIEDTNSEKSQKSCTRAEIERRKQEEIDKSRVRRVDEKGRAYGTGRRKCSVARVWIEPGEGKFLVNDKQFDVYFPIIDHRADLLRPFCETKTLGLWDVKCTVKGGGISGQVGAVRLGISRALQNWEPGLRSDLKAVDLAGSERAAKTSAEGVRLKEGSHINKSLMTLGTVIKKLSEGVESQGGHVPYRDSKLTRILQPSLGGNANTAIICNITLAQIHADETKSSLQFASRALRVTNCARVNEILTDAALLKRQKKEIEELRARLVLMQSILERRFSTCGTHYYRVNWSESE